MRKLAKNPIILGLFAFLIQLSLILLICPEKTLSGAWFSLASHWDSEWYEAIAQYGYMNTSFPQSSGLRTANVVFFPGYPYLARFLILAFGIKAKVALLLVSQTATLLFWCLFFHIVRMVSWGKQLAATLLIALFPTSWFMFVGYSESVFMLSACLMLWAATERHWILSSMSGVVMTATRLIGLPVLIAPLLAFIITQFSPLKLRSQNNNNLLILKQLKPFVMLLFFGSLGCVLFLLYCLVAFRSWHLYFDMERFFWSGTADPLFLFKLPTWLPPPLGYSLDYAPPLNNSYAVFFPFQFFRVAAYTFSEALVPIFMWLFVFYLLGLLRKLKQIDQSSFTWFLAAFLVFLITCFSLSTRHYESMSRCLFPVWVFFVIGEVISPQILGFNFFKRFNLSSIGVTLYVLISGGFWLQLLNRYYLGWWVA